MKAKQVGAKQSLQWILNGFYLFRCSPIIWIILCGSWLSIAVVFAAAVSFAPLESLPFNIGQAIFTILSPVFLAGLMTGCKALEQDKKLEIGHLFAGFRANTIPLITLGGISLVGSLLILSLASIIGGDTLMDLLLEGKKVNENELKTVSGNALSATLVLLALSVPLMMATWFAPLLIMFDRMSPYAAMRLSFFGCLSNFIPLQIYGISLIILTIISSIPYGLGFFILIPTVFASIYASYKAIFVDTSETE
ncbi:MAG: hypothetical protein E4H07_01410 [Nitrosomonadales bacterium]|nr:MAG: hypothetical protein E4H07_01410 [Nitrosomonadales bacterium]